MKYPTEQVPDKDQLFRRIPKAFIGATISPSAFSLNDDGCSVNWEKYSDPERTRVENARHPPDYYNVGALIAGAVRGVDLLVNHHPLPDDNEQNMDNRAHCLIVPLPEVRKSGKILKYQVKLANLCSLIPPD